MISYDEALARILTGIAPLESVDTLLADSRGLTLAADIVVPIDLPPFANSQMDGYALIAADTAGATEARPVLLRVAGEASAGGPPAARVERGWAVRIFTGAPIPTGADAVVPIEDTAPSGDASRVKITLLAAAGQFIRSAGEDFRAGDVGAPAGCAVTPGIIALAAASGHASVWVTRRPRVALISTGDELIAPGERLPPGHIYDSCGDALAAQADEAGGECVFRVRAADSVDSLADALSQAEHAGADVIVTCGGVSVGDRDFVRPVFAQRGQIDFWRAAIRPGKPFAFGRLGHRLFFGLPGNPASAMVTFELFVRPALLALQGRKMTSRPMLTATLTEPVEHGPGRRSFMRAIVSTHVAGLTVAPAGGQASHLLRPLAASNALLIVPEDVESLPAGAVVNVMLTGEIQPG